MKKMALCAAAALLALSLSAQTWQQDRKNPSMLVYPVVDTRTEIITPEVNGYQVIKADLHVHTIYSDAHVSPEYRIREAWLDGLDAIAITDHIEHRPCEKTMTAYLAGNVTRNNVNDGTIAADLNYSISEAETMARRRGITLIRGAEITRNPQSIGHFNALFTTDNNRIYDKDPLQSIRNAHEQGAIIQSNHPGWRKTDNEFTSVMKAAMEEGLVSGVEVFNSKEFYPDVIEKAVENGLFVAGGSDIHSESDMEYLRLGVFRDMTLVFAKDASAEAIREALENGRTLAYGYGDIAGREDLLKDFFLAAVSVKVDCVDQKGTKYYRITNHSSFPFVISISGERDVFVLAAMSSVCRTTGGRKLVVNVPSMWYGDGKHPEITIKL